MLTITVRNLSKIDFTFSYTYGRHKKFKLVLLESLGTAIGNLGYKTTVTEMIIAFYYSTKTPRMQEF